MIVAGVIMLALGFLFFFSTASSFGLVIFAIGMLLLMVGINRRNMPQEERRKKVLAIRACNGIHPQEYAKLPDELVFIGMETTGFDQRRDDIFQISVMTVLNGEVTDEFTSYVKTSRMMPGSISKATGVTNEMIAGEPPFSRIIGEILPRIHDKIIMLYNLEKEVYFLSRAVGTTPERITSINAFGVQLLAKLAIPAEQIENYDLNTVLAYLNLEPWPESAPGRCRNMLAVYQECCRILDEKACQEEENQE